MATLYAALATLCGGCQTVLAQLIAVCFQISRVAFVHSHMLRSRHRNKILRSIVLALAVDVVNVLIRAQKSAIGLLPHQAMLEHIAILCRSWMIGAQKLNVAKFDTALFLSSQVARWTCVMAVACEESAVWCSAVASYAIRLKLGNMGTTAARAQRAARRDAPRAIPLAQLCQTGLLKMTGLVASRHIRVVRAGLDWLAATTAANRHSFSPSV